MRDNKPIEIDLSGINLEEIEVFLQDGSRGVPEFVASTSSCAIGDNAQVVPCVKCQSCAMREVKRS